MLAERTAPEIARDELKRRLDGRVGEQTLHTSLLLLSEAVTNAVVHGELRHDSTVDVEGDVADDEVWLGVTNCGPPIDHAPAQPAPDAMSGRGLLLVDALSRDWGTEHDAGATSVWFQVAA